MFTIYLRPTGLIIIIWKHYNLLVYYNVLLYTWLRRETGMEEKYMLRRPQMIGIRASEW